MLKFLFNKLQARRPIALLKKGEACNFIKKGTLTQVFSCEFCEISKETFSNKTPPAAASASS